MMRQIATNRPESTMSARPRPAEAAPILLRHDRDGIATLTLNRPDAHNALSRPLMTEIQAELDRLRDDDAIKAVVIAAAGATFCSGHDLKEIRATPGRDAYAALFAQCSRMMQSIVLLPKPVIARVQGTATAAGCQFVASCDLAVASSAARFATPGVNIGLFCSTPMVALSRNVSRKQAMEMLLLGELLDADTALRFGLVNRVVPPAALDETVWDFALKIAAKSPLTLRIGKEAFYRQIELDLAAAYDYASTVMTDNMLARDAEEGIDAFLGKRTPTWRGC